jgi:hypothetical protein
VVSETPIEEPPSSVIKSRNRIKKTMLGFLVVFLVAGFILGGFYFGTHYKKVSDAQKMQGAVALSERDLRNVIVAQHLTVYWTGPVAGNKYSLFVPKAGVAVVRYLPGGQGLLDTAPKYRLVATYSQKNAFSVTQSAGASMGNLGYVTIDGNSAFYVKAKPTNVYVGLKNQDIQLEIFDPGQDQAVALSLFHGQIQKIG